MPRELVTIERQAGIMGSEVLRTVMVAVIASALTYFIAQSRFEARTDVTLEGIARSITEIKASMQAKELQFDELWKEFSAASRLDAALEARLLYIDRKQQEVLVRLNAVEVQVGNLRGALSQGRRLQ